MNKRKPNTLRIIGGRWRRRLLSFPEVPGLRPTHDRIREVLFNWLQPYIEGAACLDLFAGSGALGFEALSRGASRVTFVDNHSKVIGHIHKAAQSLDIASNQFEILQGSCPEQTLPLTYYPYDVVFLDPPFHNERLLEIVSWLESNDYLATNALLYVEMERLDEPLVFPGWSCLKSGQTKRIVYFLLRKESKE